MEKDMEPVLLLTETTSGVWRAFGVKIKPSLKLARKSLTMVRYKQENL
jgi:hypothetical protein